MLKRFSHSRGNSVEDNSGGHSVFHKRTASNHGPPSAGPMSAASHRRSTSRSSVSSVSSNLLAELYERDRRSIVQSCFQKVDGNTGLPLNVYITHVRIIEDSRYPSSRPSPDSPLTNKKKRVLIVSSKGDTMKMQVHKARENSNGTFQIGRTWEMKELTMIERDLERNEGFVFIMGKKYYWETNSAKERTVFIKSIVKMYMENSGGHVPQLVNWDLAMFYLDEQSYQRAVIRGKAQPDDSRSHQRENHFNPSSAGSQTAQAAIIQRHHQPQAQRSAFNEASSLPQDQYFIDGSLPIKSANRPSHEHVKEASNPSFSPYKHSTSQSTPRTLPHESLRPSSDSSNLPSATQAVVTQTPVPPSSAAPLPHQGSHPYSNFYSRGMAEVASSKSLHPSPYSINSAKSDPPKQLVSPVLPLNVAATTVSSAENRKPDVSNANHHNQPDAINNLLKNMAGSRSPQRPVDHDSQRFPASNAKPTAASIIPAIESRISIESEKFYDDLNEVLRNSTIVDNSPSAGPNLEPEQENAFESTRDNLISNKNINIVNDTSNELSFEPGDEVRCMKSTNENVVEETTNSQLTPSFDGDQLAKNSSDWSANNIVEDSRELEVVDYEALVEILNETNWLDHDDPRSLLERLSVKLAEAEYQFNRQLMLLPKKASELKRYNDKATQECDRMDPTLSLFTMELSSVSRDIKYVESQFNGLQVEIANKKFLWTDLSSILDSVSLPESSLEQLLTLDLNETNLDTIESLLTALHKALGAIKGSEKKEEYNLGEIRALKDRRQAYEKITNVFLKRVVMQMDEKFKNLDSKTTALTTVLSKLLVYSSLPLFCKDVSEGTFNDLIEKWATDICQIYEARISAVVTFLQAKSIKRLLTTSRAEKLELLKLWETFKKSKTLSFENCSRSDELDTLLKAFAAIEELCITYQNFVDSFFHMSSPLNFPEFIKKFDKKSRNFDLYQVKAMDSNRDSAKLKNQMVTIVFQSQFNRFLTEINQNLKMNQWHTPAVLLYLENRIRWLKPTDQEFLLSILVKINEKLKQDWEDYINEQTVLHERSAIDYKARYLFPAILSFPIFLKTVEEEFGYAFSKFELSTEYSADILTYLDKTYCLWGASIARLLAKEEKLGNNNVSKLPAVSISVKLEKCISLVRNSYWLVETLPIFRKDSFMQIIQQAKQVFDRQKEFYADTLLHQEMGDIFTFVDGAYGLINSTSSRGDPSKWAAYSPQHLSTLLSKHPSQQIEAMVDNLHKNMYEHFYSEEGSKFIELLCEKLWSCIQGQTVSFYLKLYSLIDKHYKGTHIQFNKNDIIGAFDRHKKS
ncbi:GTP-Rho binding exocyst subunit SEC3 Ecym_4472 [Eremothecium cymbalariae DBVPG|uniref:Exocyst complex component Sec3 PIP2-binding N-terminal domain-containing protein n=1 Tax=Eremothecium cymbalariae (strain CBS 270.75 / DBVPG 7215 / KCTC 17166 / NRRL Y-17582) TaxID=931890 RepID=G8JU09_ERECY|nr:hypothetical protein Ecym_4472 [Eremothecium cymbalariae DBVPG\